MFYKDVAVEVMEMGFIVVSLSNLILAIRLLLFVKNPISSAANGNDLCFLRGDLLWKRLRELAYTI